MINVLLRRVLVGRSYISPNVETFRETPFLVNLCCGVLRPSFCRVKRLAHACAHISDRCVARVHAICDRDGDKATVPCIAEFTLDTRGKAIYRPWRVLLPSGGERTCVLSKREW